MSAAGSAGVCGLVRQHLRAQVVDEVAVVARELRDEPSRVLAAAQRQRREVQPRGPALGSLLQDLHVGGPETAPHDTADEVGRLRIGETQVAARELGELATRAHPRDGHRRLRAARDDHAQVRRQPVDEQRQRRVQVGMGQQVQVVDDEHGRLLACRDVVEQRGHDVRAQPDRAHPQVRERLVPDAGPDLAQRGDDVDPEADGIVVGVVQGQPGHRARPLAGEGPRGEQRRLARARGRGHERHRPGDRVAQAREQRRSLEELGADRGRAQLGGEDRPGDGLRHGATLPSGAAPRVPRSGGRGHPASARTAPRRSPRRTSGTAGSCRSARRAEPAPGWRRSPAAATPPPPAPTRRHRSAAHRRTPATGTRGGRRTCACTSRCGRPRRAARWRSARRPPRRPPPPGGR